MIRDDIDNNGKPLLELACLSAYYGPIQVLHDISLQVFEKDIVALLGRNAAGKTTTISAIIGLVKASSGKVLYRDEDITKKDTSDIVRKGVTIVPEGRRLFPEMTVYENLQMGAFLVSDKEISNNTLDRVFELFPRLKERRKQFAGTLSGGEQQMLAIGRALMGNPNLLLLDEPSMGLAPVLVEQVFDAIKEINSSGTTIFLVEQNVALALEISKYAYVLEKGKIVMGGKGADLLSNQNIQKAYLGV